MDENPYSSPKTGTDTTQPRQRFRWRTLAVGTIGGVGVIYVCAGLFLTFVLGYEAVTGEPLYEPGPDLSWESRVFTVSSMLLGTWLILSAWQWWKGHWLRSIAMIALLIAAAQMAAALKLIPS